VSPTRREGDEAIVHVPEKMPPQGHIAATRIRCASSRPTIESEG
jgi:hypothetical protein